MHTQACLVVFTQISRIYTQISRRSPSCAVVYLPSYLPHISPSINLSCICPQARAWALPSIPSRRRASPLYLPYISLISPWYLPYISLTTTLYLPCISLLSPLHPPYVSLDLDISPRRVTATRLAPSIPLTSPLTSPLTPTRYRHEPRS